MTRRPPAEGDRLGGRYQLIRLLGEGGVGRVFLAQRDDLGGQVAIKVLRESGAPPYSGIERFRREAQSASRLKSESVVRVLDMDATDDGTPFIVMERVAGKTLAKHLSDDGPFEVARAVDIVIDVCAVLAEAHALGIVHRDIKTSNVALTRRPDGTELVKVLDFGIAKQTDADVSSLTETATVLGSPKYMSPEQIRDSRAVGPLDDLWSLAVMLQEITTGALPFEAFTVPGLFAKIVADPPIPARSARPDLPLELEALLLKALSKDPAARFPDAAELAEALVPLASPEGARRAARVRAVFTHAAAAAGSDPPPAPDAPLTSTDLDVTNAPIAREHPAKTPAPTPLATRRRVGGIAVVVGGLVLVLAGAAWRVHPSTATTEPSRSPLPSTATAQPPPSVAGVRTATPSESTPSSDPSTVRAAPPSASSSLALAPASASSTPAPSSPASAPRAAVPPPPTRPRPTNRGAPEGPAFSAAGSVPSDDEFGPRQ